MIKVIAGLLIITIIVVIHELGHFLLAKRAGIRVEEFCVGLGPRIIYKKIGETIYSIKLFPIGGACMMAGEDEESDADDMGSFGVKTVWERISVVAAGPIFNFVLAFIVAIFVIGFSGIDSPTIGKVFKDTPAYEAGIKEGDIVKKYNGKKIDTFKDIRLEAMSSKYAPVTITVETDGKLKDYKLSYKIVQGQKILGISSIGKERVGVVETIRQAGNEVGYWVKSVFVSLRMIFSGDVSRKDVTGPIGIVKIVGDGIDKSSVGGVGAVLTTAGFFIILISANLGVMNLLPLPALDGGRLLFLFLEVLRGKKVNQKFEGYVHAAGFILLMGLMVFMFYNDIVNIIAK